MGFGLPAAIGAKAAHPDRLVVDIDGDGSLLMNLQEMATSHCEKLPVKVMLLNNMHLGMVVQWEDRFNAGNRAHTYLGPIDDPEAVGQGDGIGPEHRYPDFVAIAQGHLPQDHWFALGRLLTRAGGQTALISWGGSMFEYLMPLLVMPDYDDTLLGRTAQLEFKMVDDKSDFLKKLKDRLPEGIKIDYYTYSGPNDEPVTEAFLIAKGKGSEGKNKLLDFFNNVVEIGEFLKEKNVDKKVSEQIVTLASKGITPKERKQIIELARPHFTAMGNPDPVELRNRLIHIPL